MPDYSEETNSLCKSCYYHVYREVIPFDEVKEEWEKEFDIEITDDSIIEIHTCYLLNIDLDHVVRKCTKYLPQDQVNFNNNLRLFKQWLF